SVTTGKPSKIIREGGEWQCTIPEQIKMKMPQGTLTSNSTLIGLSADGKKWYFIDVSGHSLTQIRKVLPEVSTHLVIPPKQQPVLMPR
ncbi:MAG TPA: hypothetical protein VHB48_11365, partial [Chitinophagaceae bacterium]|nr:hypothetical protein [Chitinophagaceae bacterium]